MTDTESTEKLGRDALGIALFGLAVFGAISVLMAMFRPVENAQGTTAIVGSFVGFLGKLPGLSLSMGLAWLGGSLWLGTDSEHEGVGRHIAGVLGVSLALAVLLGAAVEGAGGALGDMTGGKVSAFLTPFAGVPFGLVCLAVPVWFAWVRPHGLISWNLGQEEDRPAAGAGEAEGVSTAEAEALMPRTPPPEEPSPVPVREARPEVAAEPAPLPPLYPLDVRPAGGIPEGAQPLNPIEAPHAAPETQSADEALPLRASQQTSAAPLASGEDLVAETGGSDATHGEAPVHADVEPAPQAIDPGLEPAPEPSAHAQAPARAGAAPAEVTPIESTNIPAPSWEQPSLFVEEPVDAYGTPESVTEEVRSEVAEHGEPEVALADTPPAAPAEENGYREILASDESEEEDEDAEDEEEYEEEEEEILASDESEEEYEDAEDEEEYEDEEEEILASDESEEEDEDAEDEEEYEDAEDEEEYEDEEEEVLASDESEEEDEDAEDQEEYEEEDAEEAAELEEEPEVELHPNPPPATPEPLVADGTPEPGPEASPEPLSGAEVLQQAGDLFLARGRVAVSMLQREFSLDFKQATMILDQLQEVGLIGPYMGGKRRDILLTAEEWRERVGAL